MFMFNKLINGLKNQSYVVITIGRTCTTQIPFVSFYKNNTGILLDRESLETLKKRHPNIDKLTNKQLECTLQILDKFKITPYQAFQNPHVFIMNPITMDNYGEILRECGFINIVPKYIIRYHTLVKSKSIAELKKKGIMQDNIDLQARLRNYFQEWPFGEGDDKNFFDETVSSILQVRMYILEAYLKWRLHITSKDFEKYCRNYRSIRHKPMADIQKAINTALNDLNFDVETIRRNGFLISTDPLHTKLVLENVPTLAGMDIKDVLKKAPSILRNNYVSLMEIQKILQEYGISEEAQQRILRVFCISPETVRERLEDLCNMKEYKVFATNPRVLSLVVYKKKLEQRLRKMHSANKQCFSLNHLVASNSVFNNYMNSLGSKSNSRDIALLVSSCLLPDETPGARTPNQLAINRRLKRHKYRLYAALSVVDDNIKYLQRTFTNNDILENCQLLIYPMSKIEPYLSALLAMRAGDHHSHGLDDVSYNNLNYSLVTNTQILSLVLYMIEKKYHFTGDGIWDKNEAQKIVSTGNS